MSHHSSLSALSREHHHAFVISKRIEACGNDIDARTAMCEFALRCYSVDLLPHFQEEEERIFPALEGVHDPQRLRALRDHAALHALAERLAQGDGAALMDFGELLAEHVRFEERELFPLYTALVARDAAGIPQSTPEQSGMSPRADSPDSRDVFHAFDARGIAPRFRHAALCGVLDALAPDETMRLIDDHDPTGMLQQIAARFGRAIIMKYVKREAGEVIIDFIRVTE